MPIPITMPRLSDTMQEGTLVAWRVQLGQTVKSGDTLADVETDKATMELQSYDDGTVAVLAVNEGQTIAVGAPILVLSVNGENPAQIAQAFAAGTLALPDIPAGNAAAEGSGVFGGSGGKESGLEGTGLETGAVQAASRPRVSPLARKIAEQQGINLANIQGTGPAGRIVKRDLLTTGSSAPEAHGVTPWASGMAPGIAATSTTALPGGTENRKSKIENLPTHTIPLSAMRKTIVRRLVESKTTIPHFTVTVSVNMDPLRALRTTLNQQMQAQGIKISVNDFILRAAALSCLQHPLVNSSYSDAGIVQHGTVNVGVAVTLPPEKGGGLIVPVIREAPTKGLRTLSEEIRTLAEKARGKGLTIEDMSGGTFTVSNLGMFGVEHFEAIINPPQAAILAVGAALKKPVVRNDHLTIGYEMTLTLSADHRVIDGTLAAQYLGSVRQMLENPAVLLV